MSAGTVDSVPPRPVSAAHLYDCADVGATLVRYARRRGWNWSLLPARHDGPRSAAPRSRVVEALGAAAWHARRLAQQLPADLIHLHYAYRAQSLQWPPRRPSVIHVHGSDVSIHYQSDTRARQIMTPALEQAALVLYSTPDLAEQTRQIRPDAVYLPNPVELDDLPPWSPTAHPTVVFSSRWERRKGSELNLEIMGRVIGETGGAVRVQALDWGDDDSRERARALGAELVPRMSRSQYLDWLASAHVVVGHQGGIFAISEFQAVAIGAPTVMRLGEGLYPSPHPVLGGADADELAAQVLRALDDPVAVSRRLDGRSWVGRHHHPDTSVDMLAELYTGLAFR